jgi:hypothetical protein
VTRIAALTPYVDANKRTAAEVGDVFSLHEWLRAERIRGRTILDLQRYFLAAGFAFER